MLQMVDRGVSIIKTKIAEPERGPTCKPRTKYRVSYNTTTIKKEKWRNETTGETAASSREKKKEAAPIGAVRLDALLRSPPLAVVN